VEVVGDVAQLDHGGHVFRIVACGAHVKKSNLAGHIDKGPTRAAG
jgi:hypothetical protein